jgi:phage terminase small subunit
MKTLNPKQLEFVEYYIETGNASESARLAGFKNHYDYGQQLMTKDYIKEAIETRKREMQEKSLVTKLELIMELKDILDNTKEVSPKTAIEAIKTLNKMLGFEAPTQTEMTVKTEQPLFGPGEDEDEEIDYIEE